MSLVQLIKARLDLLTLVVPLDGLDVLVWGLRLVAEDLRFEFLSIDNLISDILL